MATQTATLASVAGGKCAVSATYDDVTWLISQVSVVNTSASPMWVQATKIDGGQTVSHTFRAGFTDTVNVAAANITMQHGSSPDPAHPAAAPTKGVMVAIRWPA